MIKCNLAHNILFFFSKMTWNWLVPDNQQHYNHCNIWKLYFYCESKFNVKAEGYSLCQINDQKVKIREVSEIILEPAGLNASLVINHIITDQRRSISNLRDDLTLKHLCREEGKKLFNLRRMEEWNSNYIPDISTRYWISRIWFSSHLTIHHPPIYLSSITHLFIHQSIYPSFSNQVFSPSSSRNQWGILSSVQI